MKRFAWTMAGTLACAAAGLGVGCSDDVSETTGAGGTTGSGTTTTASGTTTTGTMSTSTTGTSTGTGTSTTSTGTGGTGGGGDNSGDCASDADCPGSACVEITPGGFRVCKKAVVEATECFAPDFDECCTTAECDVAGALCIASPLTPYCGGPQPIEQNFCATDFCAEDLDCGNDGGSICAPVGTLGNKVRACVAAACKLDGDCAASPGGICAPVSDACCNAPSGLFCVYPGGCRSNADCATGFCQVQPDGSASCEEGVPVCPA
jgi:hypothetical protein